MSANNMTANQTSNLLIELFVEELPPKALKKLGESFSQTLISQLQNIGLASHDSEVTAYATPRRLGARITGVASKAVDKAIQQKLMPASVGLDAAGNATPALSKKLQSLGVAADALAAAVAGLKRVSDGKAENLIYEAQAAGATLAEGLQKALDEAIAKLPTPKVMTYQLADGWTDVKFVRPAHSLIALHGTAVVPVSVLGLTAGNTTQGHRFEAKQAVITITDADSYESQLAAEGAVIASYAARRAMIASQLVAAATQAGSGLQAIDDADLLDEVNSLVERPNVVTCEFEREFLDVPQECLILTMKANQKYFPLLDSQGKLSNKFLVVSNITPDDASAVIQGNERVVRPRLADAKFFFDQDRKKTLESRVEGLSKVVYHNKLGTQGERTERVARLAVSLSNKYLQRVQPTTANSYDTLISDIQKCAELAKTDLLTDMVGEFPELQGTMGRYYAINDGLNKEVAEAIEDHYKPRFSGDVLPTSILGKLLALADKLEILVTIFVIGNAPTGDKDPFALRRQTIGIVRLLVEGNLPFQVRELLHWTYLCLPASLSGIPLDERNSQLTPFIEERLKGYLRDLNYSSNEIESVVGFYNLKFWKNITGVNTPTEWSSEWGLATIPKRLGAVRSFAALSESTALAAANKRVSNILKKSDAVIEAKVDASLLVESAEKALHTALCAIKPTADAAYEQGDYAGSLKSLAALKAPVDSFFESVMVNAEDPALKANRLGLLATLHAAMNRVADLSKLAS